MCSYLKAHLGCTDQFISLFLSSILDPVFFLGMYAIKFVREFKLCCCFCKKTTSTPGTYKFPAGGQEGVDYPHAKRNVLSPTKTTSCSASNSAKGADTDIHSPTSERFSREDHEASSSLLTHARSLTPPHIAQGRGTRSGFDKYLMI